MAYLVPIHRPSSVRHALKIRLLGESADESLVVAKANRLEIYAQSTEGLVLSHARSIYGKIVLLQKIKAPDSEREHLFVGTDRYVYFSLSWDDASKQFKTEKTYIDQAEKSGRDTQTAERCLVDPSQRFLFLELFEGILTIIPLTHKQSRRKNAPEVRALGDPLAVRVEELFIRSSAFAYPEDALVEKEGPRLAIIYQDNQEKAFLQVKSLKFDHGSKDGTASADFENLWETPPELNLSASHVIPVPGPFYGVIVLAETALYYYRLKDPENPVVCSLEDPTIFTTWEQVDEKRWLLGDDFGNLYFIMLATGDSKNAVIGFAIDSLGQTSRASALTYLGGGFAYVGSHSGDSQLIAIRERAIEVVQTLPNIAPVVDFTVMDMGSREGEGQTNEYSSGQARIVTGSGAFQDGTLRSVRSGVGLEDLGSLGELRNVTNLFPLRARGSKTDVLLTSFIDETRAFAFSSDGQIEELEEFSGLNMSEETIHAQNVEGNHILQITKGSVTLHDLENGMIMAQWSAPSRTTIVAASASDDSVVISVGGTKLVALDLKSNLTERANKDFGMQNQISCLSIPSLQPNVCLVGSWHEAEMAVLDIQSLQPLKTIQLGEKGTTVPRSVLLAQLLPEQLPTLLVAMADGNVVTFDVNLSNWELTGKKSTILGTQQASLKALPRSEGLTNVFACCEHPSIIYGSEGRLVFSAVTAEKATCVCSFDSESYPGSIALASPEDLRIVLVDEERTTHVQSLLIGETVRRIAYSTKLRAFGLGTIKRTLEPSGVELVTSHFKLADEVVFKELDTFALNPDELVESVLRADIAQGFEEVERFIVGTAYVEEDTSETVRGRILVFEVTEDRKLKVVSECRAKGACRALAVLKGRIVAALTKTVVIYEMENNELVKRAAYRTSTAPIDISVTGDTIAIADLIKSVSIVRYQRGDAGESDKLVEIARHFQIAWSTALSPIDEHSYLEADAEGNLMVLRQNIDGVSVDDRRRLEITSEIQLGEMVNRIRRINVNVSDEAVVTPRAFMGTVDGSIYLFGLIRQDKQDLLMRFQQNIAAHVQSLGDIPFAKYRAFKNQVREADEPFRFVDGDLVEKFLDCAADVQEKIVEGLDTTAEGARVMVESLRRMH